MDVIAHHPAPPERINAELFRFEDPIQFICFAFEQKKKKNSRFSIRAWSKQLGYNNPSLLSDVMRGQRRLKMELALKISQNLKLSSDAQRYFEILVLCYNSESEVERAIYIQFLKSLQPQDDGSMSDIKLDIFQFLASWVNVAVFEMMNVVKENQSPAELATKLGRGVSPEQVQAAQDLLLRLRLLSQDETGLLVRSKGRSLLVDHEAPCQAVRLHHVSMMNLAIQSVEAQSFSERDLRASTIALKLDDYKKAEEILKIAHAQIVALSKLNDGEEVYQFNSQFFRLNERKG